MLWCTLILNKISVLYIWYWFKISKHPNVAVYYVESGSGKILSLFSSGPPMYSSYQQISNHEGKKLTNSAAGSGFNKYDREDLGTLPAFDWPGNGGMFSDKRTHNCRYAL